jgi:hypothetical protein
MATRDYRSNKTAILSRWTLAPHFSFLDLFSLPCCTEREGTGGRWASWGRWWHRCGPLCRHARPPIGGCTAVERLLGGAQLMCAIIDQGQVVVLLPTTLPLQDAVTTVGPSTLTVAHFFPHGCDGSSLLPAWHNYGRWSASSIPWCPFKHRRPSSWWCRTKHTAARARDSGGSFLHVRWRRTAVVVPRWVFSLRIRVSILVLLWSAPKPITSFILLLPQTRSAALAYALIPVL